MKKSIVFVSVLALLFCSFSIMSCSDSEDGVPGKGAWQKKTINYKSEKDNSTTSLEVYLYYSDSAYTTNLRNNVTIEPGLTLIITASSDSNSTASTLAQKLAGNKYVLKHYASGISLNDNADEQVEDSEGIFNMTVGDTSWKVIYTGLLVSGNTIQLNETPEPIRSGKNYSALNYDSIKQELSWKKLLIALLQ